MSAHTPGPWTLSYDGGVHHIKAEGQNGSLFCDERYYPWCSNNDADWPLVAAAPEMLAALKLALPELEFECSPTAGVIREAIAKAEGAAR